MEPSTQGYSPEQVATGSLDNGKDVVILYVKEFEQQLNRVRNSGPMGYFYTWSFLQESNTFVLFVCWDSGDEVAVLFPPKQHSIVDGLKKPKELIITSTPLKNLVDQAVETGNNFFDLDGPVVYLKDVVFKQPPTAN